MGRRFKAEEIVLKLREVEIQQGKGSAIPAGNFSRRDKLKTFRKDFTLLSDASRRYEPKFATNLAGMAGKGLDVSGACRQVGISDQTYYRWRKEYGGMKMDQAKKYKELERENTRLKRLVADQALDISILKEVQRGNF